MATEIFFNDMKAKLLNEQMGVPAGTVMEVLNDGGTRARVCIAPNGLRIAIAAENLEMVPEPIESEGPIDPETDPAVRDAEGNVVMTDPQKTSEVESAEPETYDFSQDPEPTEDEEPLDPPIVADDDFDEELPAPQGSCDGEACESCQ